MIKKNLKTEILFSELDSTGEHQFSFSFFVFCSRKRHADDHNMDLVICWISHVSKAGLTNASYRFLRMLLCQDSNGLIIIIFWNLCPNS